MFVRYLRFWKKKTNNLTPMFCYSTAIHSNFFHDLTYKNCSLQVQTKTSTVHSTALVFPAISICNTNPVKQSMLGSSPQLQTLVQGWESAGDEKRKRRKRHLGVVSTNQILENTLNLQERPGMDKQNPLAKNKERETEAKSKRMRRAVYDLGKSVDFRH